MIRFSAITTAPNIASVASPARSVISIGPRSRVPFDHLPDRASYPLFPAPGTRSRRRPTPVAARLPPAARAEHGGAALLPLSAGAVGDLPLRHSLGLSAWKVFGILALVAPRQSFERQPPSDRGSTRCRARCRVWRTTPPSTTTPLTRTLPRSGAPASIVATGTTARDIAGRRPRPRRADVDPLATRRGDLRRAGVQVYVASASISGHAIAAPSALAASMLGWRTDLLARVVAPGDHRGAARPEPRRRLRRRRARRAGLCARRSPPGRSLMASPAGPIICSPQSAAVAGRAVPLQSSAETMSSGPSSTTWRWATEDPWPPRAAESVADPGGCETRALAGRRRREPAGHASTRAHAAAPKRVGIRRALANRGRHDTFAMLARNAGAVPSSPPACLWWTPRIHFVLFVHRVVGVAPGLSCDAAAIRAVFERLLREIRAPRRAGTVARDTPPLRPAAGAAATATLASPVVSAFAIRTSRRMAVSASA